MEAQLLDGKKIAAKLQAEIAGEISKLKKKTGSAPKMVSIRTSEDHASELYLRSQRNTAQAVGAEHETISILGANEKKLISTIEDANRNPNIHGIMVQMPLPESFHLELILDSIDHRKDVEGVTSFNLGQLVLKKGQLVPCTALSCITLIEETKVPLRGKEAVVVGSSKVVGRPVSLLLLDRMATTTVCHIGTAEAGQLEHHVKRADILVVAVGKPNVVLGKWIKEGAVVIDVGINHVNGKTVGDIEFEEARKRARFITPVPGGVGPLTVTILMKNLLSAFRMQLEGN